MRLERFVATHSELSRSQVRRLIKAKRVTVNGEVVVDVRFDVGGDHKVCLDGALLVPPPLLVCFHKPIGVVSTVSDPWGRPCLADVAADLLEWGLHPVGRLDADTDGLLPFCREGTLTQRLLHPRHEVEKVYEATVTGKPGGELVAALRAGVATAEGVHTAEVRGIVDQVVTLSVTEGKHRMVRRMLFNAGFPVVGLRRIQFGDMLLGDLAPSAWREPSAAALRWAATLQGATPT